MPKVYFKTIVSGSYELPYVLLNLYELINVCDEFWITEANRTHTGDKKDYSFKPYFEEHIKKPFPKARFLEIDIAHEVTVWDDKNQTDDVLRFNEYLTRSSFISHVNKLDDKDIVISVDGDEVIFNSLQLRMLIFAMKCWPFKKPLAFLLTLRHFLFYINLYMSKYDFYGPTISHSKFYTDQKKPDWRYGGRRIRKPLGCHFSWIMTAEGMQNKILTYGHRDRFKHLASLETLESIRSGNYNLFEPDTPLGPVEVTSFKSKLLPRSLSKIKSFLDYRLILNSKRFWE